MPFTMNRDDFLKKAGYSTEDWERSALDWSNLESIAKHHDSALQILALHAGAIANRIQAFKGVHSVRWRVKDTFGLLKKILRKNLETLPKQKWIGVNVENYRSVVSDLIGVRALHLLKEDCIEVDAQIRDTWEVSDVTIFKREGDIPLSDIIERDAIENIHSAGYRSIHYSLLYSPERTPTLVEVQVRTIFQEGWSEIDHKVKYPDFSNNDLLTYFLSVFNGLSGTADDMGSFVMRLDNLIKTTDAAIRDGEIALASRDSDVEQLQQQINKLKEEGKTSTESIESLQSTVDNIKEKNSAESTNLLLSTAMSDFFHSKFLSKDAEHFRALATLARPSAEITQAISKFSLPDARIANAIKNRINPNPELLNSIKNITRHNSQIADTIGEFSPHSAPADSTPTNSSTTDDSENENPDDK